MAIHEHQIAALDGGPSPLADLQGKVVLAVNVASKCGLTPQYEQLEQLQQKYADRGFSVVGFPCNQFGNQEPGAPEEIQTFCSTTYGVDFPLTEKIEVNGPNRHPIFAELTQVPDNTGHEGDVRWNFEKFVISPDGKVTRFSPRVTPDDPAVIETIESALG